MVAEIARVATDADIVVGFPTKNFLMKAIAWLYRWDYEREHPRGGSTYPARSTAGSCVATSSFPAIARRFKPLYMAARFDLE